MVRSGIYGVKNRLKEIRMKEYMMNQTEFAKLLGVSMSTYNNMERGTVQGNIVNILMIAKALNRHVEDIWFLEDD